MRDAFSDNWRRRLALFSCGAATFVLTVWATATYRPWALRNHVEDLHFAGSVPSLGGTATAVLVISGFLGTTRAKALSASRGLAVGCVAYEILQPTLGTGVFDWYDVLACVLGYVLAFPLVTAVWRTSVIEIVPTNSR